MPSGTSFLGSNDGGFDNADEDVLALFAQQAATEEVEIAVPGGKSVRALIDATPVRAADGTVERPVVARATWPRSRRWSAPGRSSPVW